MGRHYHRLIRLGDSWLKTFLLQPSPLVLIFLFIAACQTASLPHSRNQAHQLAGRDTTDDPDGINAPSEHRFKTVPEPGMPGDVDFRILAAQNTSSYDDTTGSLNIDGDKLSRALSQMFQARHGLGNGYISAEVPFMGPFFEVDRNQTHKHGNVTTSWPQKSQRLAFSGLAGFYDCQNDVGGTNYPELNDRGCESIISGIPYFYAIHLRVAGQTLNATVDEADITNYTTTLSMRDGLRTWKYTWSPKDTNVSFDCEYTALADRARPNVAATQVRVTPRGGNVNASIIDKLDGRSAVRSSLVKKGMDNDSSIYVANHANGRPEMKAWMFSKMNISGTNGSSRRESLFLDDSNDMSIGQEWDISFFDGEPVVFTKFVGVADSNHFSNAEQTARNNSATAHDDGWDQILSEHTQAWNELMEPRLITSYRDPTTGALPDDHLIEILQADAIASRFFLFQNLLPDDGSGLNDNGVAFPQALRNAQEDYVQDKYKFSNDSALYPWTTGAWGNATGTGPVLDYEYHVNTDIALEMFQHLAFSGDERLFKEKHWPVVMGIAKSMTTLLQPDGGKWSLRNMTDPDEFANHVDNGAFTLASIARLLDLVISYQEANDILVNETWRDMADNVNIPKADSGITLEFENMPNNVNIKQADVNLINLLNPKWYDLKTAQLNHAYYIQKESPDGPAMTNAINAINENQIASSGCGAFPRHIEALIPNLRGPWMQMSEQVIDDQNDNGGYPPAFPFLTGHGGNAMIVPLGYLGLKMYEADLTIRPALPAPLQYLSIPDFYFNGNRIRAQMNTTHTTLTRLPPSTYPASSTSIPTRPCRSYSKAGPPRPHTPSTPRATNSTCTKPSSCRTTCTGSVSRHRTTSCNA
ncbi:Acid trehalase, partial [Lachnellula cervina]